MVIEWHQGDLLNEHLFHSLCTDQFPQMLITEEKIRKIKEYGMNKFPSGQKKKKKNPVISTFYHISV